MKMRNIVDSDIKIGAVIYKDGAAHLKRMIVGSLMDGGRFVFDNDCWSDLEDIKRRYKIGVK